MHLIIELIKSLFNLLEISHKLFYLYQIVQSHVKLYLGYCG